MSDENTINKIKEIFLKDEEFQTKFAFLSNGTSQIRIVTESLKEESQESLVECFLVIAQILSEQPMKHELMCAVQHVQSLSQSSNDETIH
jgi:hypothetical protein